MAIEIERKFLVRNNTWRGQGTCHLYRQGYLSNQKGRTVRVRTTETAGYLTIKGPRKGLSRAEYEYKIPLHEAIEMLDDLCAKPQIEKYRHKIPYDGLMWEVDEFLGENKGLVVAEVEISHEKQEFKKPKWVGKEVSKDNRYSNSNLAKKPYSTWKR